MKQTNGKVILVRKIAIVGLIVGILGLVAAWSTPSPGESVLEYRGVVDTSVPEHPYLAQSEMSKTHANAYSTGAFMTAGPTGPSQSLSTDDYDHLSSVPFLISMQYSSPYPDGKQVIWISQTERVMKVDVTEDEIIPIDTLYLDELPEEYIDENTSKVAPINNMKLFGLHTMFNFLEDESLEKQANKMIPKVDWSETVYSGVYSMLDRDGNFYVAHDRKVVIYADSVEGDRNSPISVKGQYLLDEEKIDPKGTIMGVSMTWDGYLAIMTTTGEVAVVSRDLKEEYYIDIENAGVIRNSLAVCEDGGIYIVTDTKMCRIQWTGTELTMDEEKGAWEASYEYSLDQDGLPTGSGSTPSLMGFGENDQFVVFTDGCDVNNMVLMWRDEIPEDWEQIPGTMSRRIAAQVPVDFGDPDIDLSFSEQSVLVNGYGCMAVNNIFTDTRTGEKRYVTSTEHMMANRAEYLKVPYGIQKFEWDSDSRILASAWVNNEVSSPSNVPCMSVGSNMVYINSPFEEKWSLAGIDWTTGETKFRYMFPDNKMKYSACAAEMQVLPNGDIMHGTFYGLMRIKNQDQ